jgi:putative DNA primase/helicase
VNIDFERIANDALARASSLLPSLLPAGRKDGNEWVCGDLKGNEGDSLKVNMRTGLWMDFASGEKGGDIISLVAAVKGMKQSEAAAWLDGTPTETGKPYEKKEVKKQEIFKPIYPVPPEKVVDFAGFKSAKLGTPSQYWIYRTPNGEIINCVYRFEKQDGGKEIMSFTYGTFEGSTRWHWKQIPDNRPLYGLERIKDSNVVLVTEGEKAADALFSMTKQPVVTWAGGSNAIKKADFSPLYGKIVYLFADGDAAGRTCMQLLAEMLEGKCKRIVLILPPDMFEGVKGWDAADALESGWTTEKFYTWAKPLMQDYPPTILPVQYPQSDYHPDSYQNDVQFDNSYDVMDKSMLGQRIIALGFDHEFYYYYSTSTKQVVTLTAEKHTDSNFLRLVDSQDWWEQLYPSKSGVNWKDAKASLMAQCHRAGVHDPSKRRGKGAWIDQGRVVQHVGDMLIVDNIVVPLGNFDTRYVYEQASPLHFDHTLSGLSAKECAPIIEICKGIRWESDLMAYYFMGWCVVAPFCGALRWRPHMWIIGAAGSGKSWALNDVAIPLLGNFPVYVLQESTAAGIRQYLQSAALPVVFEEVKGEDKGEVERVQQVLSLMRAASTDNEAKLLKGSSTGESVQYLIRSAFLLASISLGIKQHADETRISVLSIRTPPDPKVDPEEVEREKQNFANLERLSAALTPEYVQKLHNRTLKLLPTIRINARIFSSAAARVLGTSRAGDQVGILLAGAYSLHSSKEVTLEEAIEWVRANNVQGSVEKSDPDHVRCFNYLMQTTIKSPTRQHMQVDVPIGELVDIVASRFEPENSEVTKEMAAKLLDRRGLRVIENDLVIANSHKALEEIYRNSPWPLKWGKTLKQNLSAHNCDNKTVYFSGQVSSKVTAVPLQKRREDDMSPLGSFSEESIPF